MAMSIQHPHRVGSGDDITTNDMTVIEIKKKIAYNREDGESNSNTSTVTETKKRKDCASGRNTSAAMKKGNVCGSDTSTSTVTGTKERLYKKEDWGSDAITSTVMEIKKKRAYRRKKYLPHDLIMEQILTKLPVPTLLKSVLVSKLWYNSIHNDHKRLSYSHFLQSQKQPQVILSLLNVRDRVVKKTGEPRYGCHFYKFTNGIMYDNSEHVLEFQKFRGGLAHPDRWELVGYCHGLPCMADVRKHSTSYVILDPNRKDYLYIYYPAKVGRRRVSKSRIICHGFGFDPTAKEYKVVSIFRTPQKELNFLVFTLGTKSWRNVTPTSTPVSGQGGRSILKIRAPRDTDKSAIFCTTSGYLAWKIIATVGAEGSIDIQHDNSDAVNNEMEMEMLLSFNLHDEKFQFIQLPEKSTTDEPQKHLLVEYPHLLQFKGSPCIARIEKISGNGSDYPHRYRDDHKGSSSCCCCCKVHLYVLRDNDKQVWVKEESFDVRISSTSILSLMLAPDPCCFCFDCTTPPTRMFSFSDQMLLYWFSGKYLQVYNLRSEKLQLILPANHRQRDIFRAKTEEPQHNLNSGNDDIYCSGMNYQLHCHEENFISLEAFIPKGVEGVDADAFSKLDLKREDRPCLAYMLIYRGSKVFYPFFN